MSTRQHPPESSPESPAASGRAPGPFGAERIPGWDLDGLRLCPESRLNQRIGRLGACDLTAGDLLRRAAGLADELPARAQIVNGCRNRLGFLVVLCATLMRGQPSILPHDKSADALADIGARYDNALLLTDRDLESGGLPTLQIDLHALEGPAAAPNPHLDPALTAAIAFTSGTTGVPKSVERSWAWLAVGAQDYWSGLDLERLGDLSLVVTVPGQHTYGLETAAMLPLRQTAQIFAGHPLFPAEVARAIASIGAPRVLVTTPHHLNVLCRSGTEYPATAQIISATAPLPPELAETASARFGARVTEVFGCTEVGLLGTRVAGQGPRWRIADSLEIDFGGSGATATGNHLSAPVLLDDQLMADGDRHFRLGGRQGDLVKVAGNRASLEGLNRILLAIDGVADGVIFQPPRAGPESSPGAARLTAFVVLNGRSLADVEADFRSRVPAPFWPRHVREVDHIPRGTTGKVPRSALAVLERTDGAE